MGLLDVLLLLPNLLDTTLGRFFTSSLLVPLWWPSLIFAWDLLPPLLGLPLLDSCCKEPLERDLLLNLPMLDWVGGLKLLCFVLSGSTDLLQFWLLLSADNCEGLSLLSSSVSLYALNSSQLVTAANGGGELSLFLSLQYNELSWVVMLSALSVTGEGEKLSLLLLSLLLFLTKVWDEFSR